VLESNGLEYFVGADVKWAGIFGWRWSQFGWNIYEFELNWSGTEVERAGVFGLSWSLIGWTNGLEYCDGDGVNWAGVLGWSWSGIFEWSWCFEGARWRWSQMGGISRVN
jgi:hypothetical protein